ncbi:MAG: PAS domain S-box protein [Gammaproteobacteria bacterium]|nr:PAS domain S-box protein [Gammaproteobacteria bacterium]
MSFRLEQLSLRRVRWLCAGVLVLLLALGAGQFLLHQQELARSRELVVALDELSEQRKSLSDTLFLVHDWQLGWAAWGPGVESEALTAALRRWRTPNGQAMAFPGMEPVAERRRDFLDAAEAWLKAETGFQELQGQRLWRAGHAYIDAMIEAADVYRQARSDHLQRLAWSTAGSLLLTLLLLGFAWLFLLRPSLRRLEAAMGEAERERHEREQAHAQLREHAEELERSRRGLLSLMQDHVQQKARAERNERRLIRVIESTANGILQVNESGIIELANERVENMLGYARSELLGMSVDCLVPDEVRPRHPAIRARFLQAPKRTTFDDSYNLHARAKDGRLVPVEIDINPDVTDEGIQVIVSLLDTSARRRTEQQLRRIIESTANGLILTDARGRVEMVNSRIERMFGYAHRALLGMSIDELVPARFREAHPWHRQGFIAEPSERLMGAGRDLYGQRRDGSEFPVEVGLNPLVSDEGVQIICSVIDITERKLIEDRLRRQVEEIAEASRYKSEFLANMSHELRTPLNSILLLSERLAENPEGKLSAKQAEYAEVIHRSGSDLLCLINDILDLSKIEAGRMRLACTAFDTGEFAAQVERTFAPQAEAKSLAFRVEVDEGCPLRIVSDLQRLDQILKNLLSNAMKFTSSGQVGVRFFPAGPKDALPETLEWGNALGIAVSDTGIGIPAGKEEAVFQAFRQVDGSTRRNYGGTGLGLAISRRLARLLGGDITLKSTEGKGSVFTLWLPLELPAEARSGDEAWEDDGVLAEDLPPALVEQASDDAAEALPGHYAGRRILVVDDDVRNIYVMSSLLEERGFSVLTAKNGREALASLRGRAHTDLVLLDMMMPEMDGYETLREIRSTLAMRTPVIALTAKAMPEDRQRCLASGADDYLAKPVTVADLFTTIEKWLPTATA